VEGGPDCGISRWIKVDLAVRDQVGGELGDVTILVERAWVNFVPVMARWDFKKIRRTVHGVMYWWITATCGRIRRLNPLHSQAFGFGIDLCIQPLHQFGRSEEAEVPAL